MSRYTEMMKRRQFIKLTTCASGLLLADYASACSGGFGFSFSPLRENTTLTGNDEQAIDDFLNRELGSGRWEQLKSPFVVDTPEVAENFMVVPVNIGTEDLRFAGMYKRVELYTHSLLRTVDGDKYHRDYLPAVYHVSGEGVDKKNNPRAFRFDQLTTAESSAIAKVGSWFLHDVTLPFVATRLNCEGMQNVRVFAVLTPRDETQPAGVVMAEKPTRLYSCSSHFFVVGEWPDGLKSDYFYE